MNYFFITGTSKGIGRALAESYLSREQTQVVGLSRQNTILHESYQHISIDLSDIGNLTAKVASLFPALSQPEQVVLINNAGMIGEVAYTGEVSAQSVAQVFSLNTIAPALLMNAFIAAYSHLGCPKTIINISSGAGQKPTDGWASYCASKAALDMFSKTVQLEQEQRKANFKIFSVAPGVVDTDMQQQIRETDKHQFSQVDRFVQLKKQKLLLPADFVARKIDYLLRNREKFKEVIQDVRSY